MTENNTTQVDLKDVLGLIDRANESFCYEVWVPSLKKNIMFREINTSQQKRLIKAIIDSPLYNTEFIYVLKQVIDENCADTSVITDKLTIIDKMFIAIAMRSTSVSDLLEFQIPVAEGKTVQRGISLIELIKKTKENVTIPESLNITDEKGIFTIECSIPTIATEYNFEKEVRGKMTQNNPETPEQIREVIGDMFMAELVKYINTLTIKVNDTINKIDFNSLDFINRIKLTEKLPVKVVEKLVEFGEKVRNEIDKIVVIKFDQEIDGKVQTIERRLSIDANFFINS
jgi:hypothetical protein